MKDAQKLNREWGDKPCNHPHLEKEHALGAQTGDYVCTTCGESFSRETYRIMESKKDNQEK